MCRPALRLALLLGLLLHAAAPARAVPPPNLPLPPCVEDEDGFKRGACPKEDPDVSGSYGGWFSYNSSAMAYIDPQIPVCSSWGKYDLVWSPSPCYSATYPVEVLGCAWVSVLDDRFYEGSCKGALFSSETAATAPGDLFDVHAPEGGRCGATAAFSVYVYGGPANQPDRVWSAIGPSSLGCEVDYLGPEPDGLYGPTWVKLSASIAHSQTNDDRSEGVRRTTHFYVPIHGQLRDLGPVAGFVVSDIRGAEVAFENRSIHTTGEAMTYRWDFGDGGSSGAADPTHTYARSGTYEVKLTARDATGDEDDYSSAVTVDFKLVVEVTADERTPQVGEDFGVDVVVANPFDAEVTTFGLAGAFGLVVDPTALELVSGPDVTWGTELAAGERLAIHYVLRPLATGEHDIEVRAQGEVRGVSCSNRASTSVRVPVRLHIELTTSVDSETKVGDELDVVAHLRNDEDGTIDNIKADRLELVPSDMLSQVRGPLTEGGADPRVSPLSLGPGESTTISWRYKAEGKGKATLTAFVSGKDPDTGELFFVSDDKTIAIETAALDITDFRLQPGAPVPGTFGNLRGTITNIGSVDVTDIDFELTTTTPQFDVITPRLEGLDPSVSPRIAKLEAGASQEFLIPVGLVLAVGDRATYEVELEMTGQAAIDGDDAEVVAGARAAAGLDLSVYWTSLLEEVRKQLLFELFEFIDGVNDWGNRSTLGGIAVGGGQGALAAFQKMGDGLLSANDFLAYTIGNGGEELNRTGQAVVDACREYLHTTSKKKMAVDLANLEENLAVGAVDTFAQWLYQIDKAQAKGDVREVSRLISEPGTELAIGLVVNEAGGQILGKLAKTGAGRKVMAFFKRGVDVEEAVAGGKAVETVIDAEYASLREMPTGVRLTGETVARAGLTTEEHAWMIEMAQEHGVAFFVRPRPAEAAKWARLGYNGKPMLIKWKSVSELDAKWLGFEDFIGREGLVVMREPKDPYPALKKAIEQGELAWESPEVKEVVERYGTRYADWLEHKKLVDKLNAEGGFEVQRYGKTIKTKVIVDEDGLVRFSHNGQPVFSDVDIWHIAKPNGDPIPKQLYDDLLEAGGAGFDAQHGATANSGDFYDAAQAKKFIEKYGAEHTRGGGDPLLIVQPDVTTLGYVKSIELPAELPSGTMGDLYQMGSFSYEGAGYK
ncbi:MAG: PKD domain-containing protein [Myxococcales bacterium]|nr:PKD domain-containing protein [Myxococcales bacterium]